MGFLLQLCFFHYISDLSSCMTFPCWAVAKRDVLKIGALDQWCLRKHCPSRSFVSVWPHCPNPRQNRCHLNSFPFKNWRRPPGCCRTTWMKTIQQDLKFNNLCLNQFTVDVAPLRRVETDVYIRCYAFLVVHATKEERSFIFQYFDAVVWVF